MFSRRRKTMRSPGLYRRARAARTAQSRKYFLEKRHRRIKLLMLIILIILLLGISIYFLFFSQFFQIKDENVKIIKINNNNLISEQELRNIIHPLINEKLFLLSRGNIVLFKTGRLTEIMKKDSRIAFFKVEKRWPNSLIVEIGESQPVALLVSLGDDRPYYLNSRGQVIHVSAQDFATPEGRSNNPSFTTPEGRYSNNIALMTLDPDKEEKTFLPVFYDQTSINLDDSSYIKLLKSVLTLIKSDILAQNEIRVNSVKISEQAGIFEVEIITLEGWRVLINSEADFEQQITNLGLVLREKIENRENLEQIDLRFGEKIFYKLKEEKEE